MVILALVAHPDDESFFMGGTLCKHVARGDSVIVSACTDGVGARGRDPEAKARRSRAYFHAGRIIGAKQMDMHDWPDQGLEVYPRDIKRWAQGYVDIFKPDLVFTHYPLDLNSDHRVVAEAALLATRMVCPVYCCSPEFPSRALAPFKPTVDVDILKTQATKLEACACYVDELRPSPHPRSMAILRTQTFEPFLVIE